MTDPRRPADHPVTSSTATASSPLVAALHLEWDQLNESTVARERIGEWADAEPALAGLVCPADVIAAIKSGSDADKDRLLGALLRLFQSGNHSIAGRILLQAMLPKLLKMSGPDEERRCEAVGGFWAVITDYPIQRRASKVAAGLALDTLHRLPRFDAHNLETPADPDELTRKSTAQEGPIGVQSLVDALDAVSLQQVLDWAVSRRVISQREAEMLSGVYRQDGQHLGPVAERLQISQTALRQRCSRASRKVAEAVRHQLLSA